MELSSSAVECRIRNQESLGLNPLCCHLKVWAFSFSPRCPSSLICINEYMAMIDSRGNVSDLVVVRNCCVARMLPREAELVSE